MIVTDLNKKLNMELKLMNKKEKDEAFKAKLIKLKKDKLINMILSFKDTNERLNKINSNLFSECVVLKQVNDELKDLVQITDAASRNFKTVIKSIYNVLTQSMVAINGFEENIRIFDDIYGPYNERNKIINDLKKRMEENGLDLNQFDVE